MKKIYSLLLLLSSFHYSFAQIIQDPAPRIVFDSTVTTGVGNPFLRIKANAVDNTPGATMRTTINGKTITIAGDAIDTLIDASLLSGPLSIAGVDTLGQITTVAFPYSLNMSGGFRLAFTAPLGSDIIDVGHGKVVAAAGENLLLIDTATGVVQTQPYYMGYPGFYKEATLTSEGVYFQAQSAPGLYAWKSGGTPALLVQSPRQFAVGGNAIAWLSQRNDSLYFKPDMDAPVSFVAAGVTAYDVGEDGVLVYALNDQSLYRYENGAGVRFYTDPINSNRVHWMIRDRDQIAFSSTNIVGATFLRVYNNGSAPLIQQTNYLPEFGPASVKLDSGRLAWANTRSVEARWPAGLYLKLPGDTARNIYWPESAGNSIPLAIDASHGVLVAKGGARGPLEYVPYAAARRLLGANYAKFYDRNRQWFVSQKNALYFVDPGANTSYKAESRDLPVFYNTPKYLGLADFTGYYSGPESGPGQLDEIEIIKPTTWGEVYLKDGGRISGAGLKLKRYQLDSLRYVPTANLVGADTLRWRASSGTGFSNVAALTFINYPDLVQAPRIAGLDSAYGASADADNIRIINLPPAKWRTQVSVVLDDETELPVGGDSSFTITPSAYSAGYHYLRLAYQHPLDSVSVQVRFRVLSPLEGTQLAYREEPVTPELKVGPNPFSSQFSLFGLQADRQYRISLLNGNGQLLYNQTVQGHPATVIKGDALPAGTYFLQVFDTLTGKTVIVKQLVKM